MSKQLPCKCSAKKICRKCRWRQSQRCVEGQLLLLSIVLFQSHCFIQISAKLDQTRKTKILDIVRFPTFRSSIWAKFRYQFLYIFVHRFPECHALNTWPRFWGYFLLFLWWLWVICVRRIHLCTFVLGITIGALWRISPFLCIFRVLANKAPLTKLHNQWKFWLVFLTNKAILSLCSFVIAADLSERYFDPYFNTNSSKVSLVLWP